MFSVIVVKKKSFILLDTIYNIKFMAKFVEMDEKVNFKDQIEEKIEGSVILINKFNVESDKAEQFLKDWREDATNFKQQP